MQISLAYRHHPVGQKLTAARTFAGQETGRYGYEITNTSAALNGPGPIGWLAGLVR